MMPYSEEDLTATLVNLYHVCRRQAWLHARGVRMEHTSEAVADGKWLHQHSYPQRARKYRELDLGIAKIDYYDPHTRTIHEIKRSDHVEAAHEAQLRYYLYLLHLAGIEDATGVLEYPRLRKKHRVALSPAARAAMPALFQQIIDLLHDTQAPPRRDRRFCQGCSYHDFCWTEETDCSSDAS